VIVRDSHAAYWLEKRDRETVAIIRIKSVPFESQLLLRLGGWDDAARMVFEHPERCDGLGYPKASSGPKKRTREAAFCRFSTPSDRSSQSTAIDALKKLY
jgi:hypothetical protein